MSQTRILIVEDEWIVADNLQDKLQNWGYAVPAVVSTGEEAIRKAGQEKPDLVLMDIMLAGQMDGVQAADEIRARFDVPVIYVTAYADDEILERARITEPFGYVLKPFRARELHIVIEMALYKHQAERKLKQYQEHLEELVSERTAELAKVNTLLQADIAARKRAEEELRQSHARLERALKGTIHALASAIEMRDPYTAGHQRRVSQLACAIAKEMGLPQQQIEGIRMAGLVHDIGKIGVPVGILSKPARITEPEFTIIETHSQAGYEILNEVTDFPWPVAEIVLQHHESMDGSGYPQRLSGEEILLEARILVVADVVEAMASHRPYRPARGLDKALEEIAQNKGVLYDPQVVDACLRLFTEKGFTFLNT